MISLMLLLLSNNTEQYAVNDHLAKVQEEGALKGYIWESYGEPGTSQEEDNDPSPLNLNLYLDIRFSIVAY